ncbi:MAG TPA: hemerythrin domain-containing protein [Vicinamibacteria bacterium]|jgi:hemerythrin superfamily protein
MSAAMKSGEALCVQHSRLKDRLAQVQALAGSLRSGEPEAAAAVMKEVLRFLECEVQPHAEWEERVLYPLLDRRLGRGRAFTATLRYEHRVIDRWITELAREAARHTPDLLAFARRTDKVLGVLEAHFEAEEEVLPPALEGIPLEEQSLYPHSHRGWGAWER